MFAGHARVRSLCPCKALVESGVTPVAVLTQPDRPAGRGKKLTASPVKEYALEQGIDVLQPTTLRDDAVAPIAGIERRRDDRRRVRFIVAATRARYSQTRLPINVHASLLPRWRGAAPIQAAILARLMNRPVYA